MLEVLGLRETKGLQELTGDGGVSAMNLKHRNTLFLFGEMLLAQANVLFSLF